MSLVLNMCNKSEIIFFDDFNIDQGLPNFLKGIERAFIIDELQPVDEAGDKNQVF